MLRHAIFGRYSFALLFESWLTSLSPASFNSLGIVSLVIITDLVQKEINPVLEGPGQSTLTDDKKDKFKPFETGTVHFYTRFWPVWWNPDLQETLRIDSLREVAYQVDQTRSTINSQITRHLSQLVNLVKQINLNFSAYTKAFRDIYLLNTPLKASCVAWKEYNNGSV